MKAKAGDVDKAKRGEKQQLLLDGNVTVRARKDLDKIDIPLITRDGRGL